MRVSLLTALLYLLQAKQTNKCSLGVLLNFLSTLGIDVDTEHEYFGDVKKCLETFRKQLYIKREKKVTEASNEERYRM